MRPIPTLRPWLIPAFTLGLAPGCGVRGNGESATDTRALGDFDAVDVAGGLLVFVTPNPAPSARVTCDENLLPYIHTVVRDRTLFIAERGEGPGWVRLDPQVSCSITVSAPALRSLDISGSSDVVVEVGDPKTAAGLSLDLLEFASLSGSGSLRSRAPQHAPSLHVDVSGSGSAHFDDLSLGQLTVELSGSGLLEAAGTAEENKAEVSGSGALLCRRLRADSVKLDISGSGDATVYAKNEVNINLSGSGDVDVWGAPPSVHTEITGSGDVKFHD
jgi:hypothetical protein